MIEQRRPSGADPVDLVLTALVGSIDSPTVVDVGGGSGTRAVPLAVAGCRLTVVDSSAEKPVRAIRALTDGGVDTAFEVVGHPETIRLAWGAIRPGGTVVVVGLAPKGVDAAVPASSVAIKILLLFFDLKRNRNC